MNSEQSIMLASRPAPVLVGMPYEKDLRDLFALWQLKAPRNIMRSRYYEGHNTLKNIGIAIPPDLTDIETVVGWPAKAVDSLAVRSRFDTFTGDEGVVSMLDDICDANDFQNLYRLAVPSELIHSCAAITVNRGDDGMPIIRAHSAIECAMLWDYMRNRIKCGITVADIDENGNPTAYNLYESEATVVLWRDTFGGWKYETYEHPMGRPMIEPLVYRKSLSRPFGSSRISRAVMSITDSAMRTALRAEIGAELFTSPQKVILGAPDNLFDPYETPVVDDDIENGEEDDDGQTTYARVTYQARWEAYIGAIMAITRDGEGNLPQFLQVAASSMEPHIAYLRSLASRFSGETNVPISDLGIVQDNPSSAEAMYAAEKNLVIDAEYLNEANGHSLRNVAQMALAVYQNEPLSALTTEERSIGCHFMNPARPSLVSQSDAMTKQASTYPGIVRTRVYWEELGYTDDQVDQIMAEFQREQGSQLLQGILSGRSETE